MENEWKSPRIIVGPPVSGNFFFPRDGITENIWYEIRKGSFVLISAPRRFGKTSILKHMFENQRVGYKLYFQNIQGEESSEKFYKKLFEIVVEQLNSKDRTKMLVANYFKSKKLTEIDFKGKLKFEHTELDFREALEAAIPMLKKCDETVVILLDELPEVLYKLHTAEKNNEAQEILDTLRKWRQDDRYSHLKFVLAGSVGIHYVVKLIAGRLSSINDLTEVRYTAFTRTEALEFIEWSTKDATIKYNKELANYMIDKVGYCLPYYMNLMLGKIDETARKKADKTINTNDIDTAMIAVTAEKTFEEWKSRLKNYMPVADFTFINELLIHAAHKDSITIQEIYNKAVKHKKQDDYMSMIRDLVNDGYLQENQSVYTFISPFLKQFWKNDNPIYNG